MSTTTSVRYIGIKPVKEDNVARTGLAWTPGQVLEVDTDKAGLLLKHPDVWVLDSPIKAAKAQAIQQEADATMARLFDICRKLDIPTDPSMNASTLEKSLEDKMTAMDTTEIKAALEKV